MLIEVPDDETAQGFADLETLSFQRSPYCTDDDGVRQHINILSSLVDGSNIYGSTDEVSQKLRSRIDGRLATSAGDLPPNAKDVDMVSDMDLCISPIGCYAVGDSRGNENPGLTSLHVVFLRLHNLNAAAIKEDHPRWNDDRVFNNARKLTVAQWQRVVFEEFLPTLLGDTCPLVSAYQDFSRRADARLTIEFADSAYRFGHSAIPQEIALKHPDGTDADPIGLLSAFFDMNAVNEKSVPMILAGLANQKAEAIDNKVVDALRNMLFENMGFQTDLLATNIQRGRDHALVDYRAMRRAYRLSRVRNFDDITSDGDLADALEDLYGDINDIDVFVGGLAEDKLPGSHLGELFSVMICEQFTSLMNADPFFYKRPNYLTRAERNQVEATTMKSILEAVIPEMADTLPDKVFGTPPPRPPTTPSASTTNSNRNPPPRSQGPPPRRP
eukprot:m.33040 g.33040  ORF g.33040 m.33040 type:complete len:443 (-) comp15137_c0_seq1:38-1366(-)